MFAVQRPKEAALFLLTSESWYDWEGQFLAPGSIPERDLLLMRGAIGYSVHRRVWMDLQQRPMASLDVSGERIRVLADEEKCDLDVLLYELSVALKRVSAQNERGGKVYQFLGAKQWVAVAGDWRASGSSQKEAILGLCRRVALFLADDTKVAPILSSADGPAKVERVSCVFQWLLRRAEGVC